MKKILSMILAFTLAFGAVTLPVAEGGITFTTGISASAEETSDGFEYEINDDDETVTITGYTGDKEDVKIPDEINGMKVTCIGIYAFSGCSNLTNVTIPDSVTSIGVHAFRGTSWLANQQKINPLVIINGILIDGTTASGDVEIPDTVKVINDYAFEGIYNDETESYESNITSVTIPDSVTSIGDSAFRNCSGLTGITIPDSIEYIGYGAFYNCSGLKNVTIPQSVTYIDDYAFGYYYDEETDDSLKVEGFTITCYKGSCGLTYARDNGFNYQIANSEASDYKYSVNDEENKTITIDDYYGTDSDVDIPSEINGMKVTGIGNLAFYNCSSLINVKIPESVTSIGSSAFKNTPWLANQQKINPIVVVNGILIDGTTASGNVKIPDTVKVINDYAFEGIYNDETESYESNITSVTIPDGVTSIGESAFRYCSGLTSVTIPESVAYIGGNAFYNCSSLKNVTIPQNVTSIGENAFGYYYNEETDEELKVDEFTITCYKGSCGLTYARDNSFNYKIANPEASDYKYSINDEANKTITIDKYFGNDSDVTIPETIDGMKVTSIGNDAFYNCLSLKNVKIPDSVTSIGSWAFENCSGLTGITIPASVTHIEGYAFGYYCDESTNWEDTKIPGFKVKCYKNTAGYNYAADNGFDYELISEHTHSYTSKVTKQPTCTEEGIRTYTCSCGDTYTEKISAKGHKYTTKVVKPTCTAKGYTLHTCSVCKKSYKDNYTNALGHKYVKVKVVKPTLKSKGYTLYKCSRCGATVKKNVVPALVSLTKAKITGIKNTTYTGKQIKPVIKVVIGKTTLKKGRDYSVVYGKNKIGRAVVKIVGKGKYAGSVTKYFRILPRKTAVAVKSTVRGKISATVSKRSEATKYQIQLSSNSKFKGAKTYTVKLNKATLKGTSKKVYYVKVRTVYGNYASSWSAVKKVRVK